MSLSGALPLDPRAFLMDENVRMMTEREAWCYIRLLMHQWEEGSIPKCPQRLSAILTEGPRAVTQEDILGSPDPSDAAPTLEAPLERSLWHSLKRCFSVASHDPERLLNPRLHRDREEWIGKQKRYRSAGRQGGRASSRARATKAPDDLSDAAPTLERSLEVTSKQPSTRSRSRSRSRSQSERERRDPPDPPERHKIESVVKRSEAQIGKMRVKSSRQKGREIPEVSIPAELDGVIDAESFAERVMTCSKVKPVAAWQKELDRLAPLVGECGADAVRETWLDATASGWQGCTPDFVRNRSKPGKVRGNQVLGRHARQLFSKDGNG